jgi:adenylyltransferase/sulfurtransferase
MRLRGLSKPKEGPMSTNDQFSREIAAGYDPDRLAQMRVLLVGAGALGQNVGVNLALCQVGQICLVDFDQFESHNATRSPCFPSSSQRRRWGSLKAAVVARKLRELVSWSERHKVTYFTGPIQRFGDAPFREATVVVSAVDSNAARAYIGSMARKHWRPLVEGGFHGPDLSYCVLANDHHGPCWLCHQQLQVVDHLRSSCTAGAKEVEQAGFVPATQPAAAALGALMAEAVIQLGHQDQEGTNRRVYTNVRSAKTTTVRLTLDDLCQGRHAWPQSMFTVSVDGASPAAQLLRHLSERLERPSVTLPHRFVVSAPCAECFCPLQINQPEWAMLDRPRCNTCGGPWNARNREPHQASLPLAVHTMLSEDTPELFSFPLATLGIVPGTLLEVTHGSGATCLVEIPGFVPPTPL